MMQHKFDDISKHVSLKGMLALDKIAHRAAVIAQHRESASSVLARSTGGSGWIIVQVAYGRELSVENAMKEVGIEVNVPMRMGPERKRHGKRIPAISMPVFNGIVFVFSNGSASALEGVRSFDYVKGVLMNSERPSMLTDETVNNFSDMAKSGAYDWGRPAGGFIKDQKVRIVSGPFVGFEVVIDSFAGAENGDAVVTITIFGKPTVFNLPLVMLEKV